MSPTLSGQIVGWRLYCTATVSKHASLRFHSHGHGSSRGLALRKISMKHVSPERRDQIDELAVASPSCCTNTRAVKRNGRGMTRPPSSRFTACILGIRWDSRAITDFEDARLQFEREGTARSAHSLAIFPAFVPRDAPVHACHPTRPCRDRHEALQRATPLRVVRSHHGLVAGEDRLTFEIIAVGSALFAVAFAATLAVAVAVVVAVAHLLVAIFGGAGAVTVAVTVATVIVAVAAVVLARRRKVAAAARRHAAATRRAIAAHAIAATVEAPRGRGRGASPLLAGWVNRGRPVQRSVEPYLDLEHVLAADALVVHLVVRIVGIAAVLVFDEGEACPGLSDCCVQAGRRTRTAETTTSAEPECRSERGARS